MAGAGGGDKGGWSGRGWQWSRHRCMGGTTSSDETSGKSDNPVTTRAVPATYEPKDCHREEYRRLQPADFGGKGMKREREEIIDSQKSICSQLLRVS